MKTRLVELLRCIHCSGSLQCRVEREDPSLPWSEILEGELKCERCSRVYLITGGIPRMLAGDLSDDVRKTVGGFGWEWEKFDDQIQDTHMTSSENFLDFIWPVDPEFFQGKVVLDAGCGMGRFLKLGAEFGSQEIIGVDLSGSVDVAYRHVRALPNTHVVQADIMTLPLRASFDYIFSIGVLQFLIDPQVGFDRLINLLVPGGTISVWVYACENNGWIMRFITPVRQRVTSRLPSPVLYWISRLLGLILYVGIRFVYKPANEIGLAQRFAKLLPYNDYLYYSSQLAYYSLVSVVFDHLTPTLVKYLSKEEVEGWFSSHTFDEVQISSRNGMSWRATGALRNFALMTAAID